MARQKGIFKLQGTVSDVTFYKSSLDGYLNPDEMNLLERIQAPTPKFFRVLRTVGLSLAAAGGTILAAPIALPAAIVTAAGYIVLGAGVLTAVSQTAVETSAKKSTD